MKQYAFFKQYEKFMLQQPEYAQLLSIESDGDSLHELLTNTQLHVVNGLGIEIAVSIGDLQNDDYRRVEADVLRVYLLQKAQDVRKAVDAEWADKE